MAGPGRQLFAFFAAMAGTERECIRASTVEVSIPPARENTPGPAPGHHRRHAPYRHRPWTAGESLEEIQPGQRSATLAPVNSWGSSSA